MEQMSQKAMGRYMDELERCLRQQGAEICRREDGSMDAYYQQKELGVEEMESGKVMGWEYMPNPAPEIATDPPEPVCCTQFERCKGCPYPAHGFLCWGPDGECLRTLTEKCGKRKE